MAIFRFIYNTAVMALILTWVFYTLSVYSVFGIRVMAVQSESMEPSLGPGSAIIVFPQKSYKTGDIISFLNSSNASVSTTHRVASVKIENGSRSYVTKGDANGSFDKKEVLHSSVLGKVVLSIPLFGKLIGYMNDPFGFSVLVASPAAFIVLEELRKISGQIRKNPDPRTTAQT